MATLSITVDDTQVPRVRTAYGVSTNAELRNKIIADIRNKVVNYEVSKALSDAEVSIVLAQNNATSSADAARQSAEAISIT